MQTSLDIKNPGLRTLPPGVERYYVKGGGLSVIEVSPEDKIEIVNDEGKQTCEIIVFNTKGKSDLSILNLKENSNANFSKKTISQDEKISKLFKRKNIDLNKAKSSIIFDKMKAEVKPSQIILKNERPHYRFLNFDGYS